ncbi:15-hydroxyprostaglandin dehydrogenase [NAD(+)]-like [Centruroides sculpturatus]|uniref:15-hydroxyprostaglandin dehydrogenase [NAD(+)]-like n=1 Tax=Centruroides sculpturatus TaxID=218467 RepID=UPI000C6E6503|nr:15-hydroxyprostaglandin dehydrogenase [NAD(+)]-like [Centruroides sculpturatus]
MDIKQGVALVTGAAQGIGKAICETLLNKGCKVCCSDVNSEIGNKTVDELQKVFGKTSCIFLKCDVSSFEEFEATYQKTKETFGNVNILINNAGVGVEKVVDVNLNGVINGCFIAYKYMGKHNGGSGGSVVNVASIAGLLPCPYFPVYAATKGGVVSLTRSYGHKLHYEKSGITFMCLCPSAVNTDLFWSTTADTLFAEEFTKIWKSRIVLEPSAIAEAIIQLLEDGKNGAVMTVIGGKENTYVPMPEAEMFY